MSPLCPIRLHRFIARRRTGPVTLQAATAPTSCRPGLAPLRGIRLVLVASLLTLLFVPAPPLHAANTIVVNSLDDPTPPNGSCEQVCTLRDAIVASASGDTITFSVSGQISLARGLAPSHDLTIQGPGASSLTLDGRGQHEILVVSGTRLTLSGLTIQNGHELSTGAIRNFGTLTVTDSALVNNLTSGSGGAIYNAGTLTVTNSTLSGNKAGLSLADFGVGGAIFSTGSLTVTNSTLSGNAAGCTGCPNSRGGAIASSSSLSVTVTSSTLSGNSANTGGGIFNVGPSTIRLRNSILVNSPAGGNCFGPAFLSDGNNLSDTAACFAGGTQGDIVTSTPGLGPLAMNAPGTTMTHALLDGSPAIDGVVFNPSDCGTSIATDQRGVVRPQTIFSARCDIGAYERVSVVPTISTIGPRTTSEDMPTSAIAFTVGDDQTPPASLTVTATTSDQNLVPNTNVVLGGSGANRTVTVTPAANQNGATDVTLTVSDGAFTSSTTFTLTVTPVNDAPVNGVPAPQTTTQDSPLVFSASHGNPISISDVDAGSSPVRVALTAIHGTLALNGTTGLTVESGADGSATITVTGSLASLNDALNGLSFTSTPGYSGPASLLVASDDLGNTGSGGARSDSDTIAIAVTAVNHPPTAHDDTYIVAAGQTLSVPVVTGVLANDTDVDSPTLTAVLVQGAAHGSLTLNPNGSLTYTPSNGFAGADSFTYRASDGTAQSQPATVTLTVTPTACFPRPKVQTSPTAGGGKLNVHVEATPLNTAANNPISRLEFGTLQNAKVTLNGQVVTSGQIVSGTANTFALDFTVERVTPGQATTVPFTVVDGCGSWRTFVGGGTAAGF